MNDGNPISDLLRTASQLTGLLDRETGMLQAMKPSDIKALHQDKLALSTTYGAQIKALKDNPALMGSIPADVRAHLKATMESFQAALAANRRGLHAVRAATESTLRAIADEVQAKTDKHKGYAANGGASRAGETGRTSAQAFAFDQSL